MTIKRAEAEYIPDVLKIFRACKVALDARGIFQWTDTYPNLEAIVEDEKNGQLFLLQNEESIQGVVTLNEHQDEEYAAIAWKFDPKKVLVIHRLAVHPDVWGKGYAQMLMDFAEDFARQNGYTSIRLDAFVPHERVIQFYQKRNYHIRGETYFSGRKQAFYCMEKDL